MTTRKKVTIDLDESILNAVDDDGVGAIEEVVLSDA
jgi:hypothetical protein